MRSVIISGMLFCAATAATVEIGTMQIPITNPFSC
jgi:hypothetical protein